MTDSNKYPEPDRSDHTPQQDANREFYPELDLGGGKITLKDGRPAVFENWFDKDMELYCRTVFYSTLEIEDWTEAQHLEYFVQNGLMEGKEYHSDALGLKKNF